MSEKTLTDPREDPSSRSRTASGWFVALGAVLAILVLTNSIIASYQIALLTTRERAVDSGEQIGVLRAQLVATRNALSEAEAALDQAKKASSKPTSN